MSLTLCITTLVLWPHVKYDISVFMLLSHPKVTFNDFPIIFVCLGYLKSVIVMLVVFIIVFVFRDERGDIVTLNDFDTNTWFLPCWMS